MTALVLCIAACLPKVDFTPCRQTDTCVVRDDAIADRSDTTSELVDARVELEGDSLEELRAKLNTLYARRCGHSPDQQALTETGQVLPLGELAVVVGCLELDELRRAALLDDNQRSYGPAGPPSSCEGIDDGP